MKKSILYVAGRSGGHIMPLIAHARKEKLEHEIVFITTATNLDIKIILDSRDSIDFHYPLKVDNLPKSVTKWFSYLKDIYKAIGEIKTIFSKHKPEKIYTTGGYIGALVTFVAFFMKIPVHVYHLDAIPGRAGALIHLYADYSYVCIKSAEKKLSSFSRAKINFEKCPLRFSQEDKMSRSDALALLNLDPSYRIIFIMGGSQGSRSINMLVKKI